MLKQNRRRIVVVATAHLVGSAGILLLYPALGPVVGGFGLAVVLVGAVCFGRRGGLATAAVQSVLNGVILRFLVHPHAPFSSSAAVGMALMLVAGYVVGNQRDLSRRLREELVRNEWLRVREKETLAAIPDAMIRAAPDETYDLQGASVRGSLGQVLERALGRAMAADQQAELAETIRRVRDTGQARALTFELPGPTTYDVRCLPAAAACVLVVIRDVTEQRRLLRRVASAENLASLGTLAAGLAHEVNNPLTYVITSLYSAKLVLGQTDRPARAELDAALNGCWRIRDLVKNILETTTSQKDIIEPVSLSEVVQAAVALVAPQVRHRATIHWTPHANLAATAHRTKLVQVVANLLVNASQAFADNRASANQIHVRTHGEGSQVLIEVEDNGTGMDEATKLRALEPFFTTKEPGQGTGLGLFLCNSIVESLGGQLHLDSERGKGTRVTVRLPMAHGAPVAPASGDGSRLATTVATPRLRVMVVDDEPEIRRGVARILREKHDLCLCGSGADALAHLVAGERFDVIFCDLLMPEMTGIELYQMVERHFREQADRMVFLTGGATSESSRLFIEQQGERVVSKPFHPTEIVAIVLAHAPAPLPTPTPLPVERPES